MLILKHLFDWSYDDLEQEVRANLVYRAFTRIDAGEVPDAQTILKIAGALARTGVLVRCSAIVSRMPARPARDLVFVSYSMPTQIGETRCWCS